ncbi:MAG: hypothetical protein OSJ70_08020 [Bacilli bacterium]|nr:hypothetical protein [Bacilli bacterium]
MRLIDYTGKLNNHDDYLAIINKLENNCQYIEYVLINDEEIELLEKFEDCIISFESKNKWWGTKSSQKNKVYKIKASKEIFKYLKQFETFCKYTMSSSSDIVEETDFGLNDIAFLDEKEIPLLFTTTHEGYITVRDDILR